ncbi:hypothetical protein [Synechococcus sp. SYN20]|uniref:hypothetical protein n=1 Tax=Synechococcus sp. SYN20 TaxID=1050714 RepID=UPI0016491E3F|nr:hypothetical protein [Synechococcus sp. SYN20]
MILIVGATGLMIRQLMARKLGANESYQQLAETAAVNGFNRILGKLNNNKPDEYLGYLYAVNNREKEGEPGLPAAGYQWNLYATETPPLLPQLCTNTTGIINTNGITWNPLQETELTIPTEATLDEGSNGMRNDGNKGAIKTSYRLRGYAKPSGEGIFEVEGFVRRDGDQEDEYFSRALLTRSLSVVPLILQAKDWGVIAGNYLELGTTSVAGASTESKGKIVWNVSSSENFQNATNCTTTNYLKNLPGLNFSSSNTSTESAIARDLWPIVQGAIPLSHYDKGKTIDKMPSNTNKVRIWSFDDQGGAASGCHNSVVCTRAHDTNSTVKPQISETQDSNTGQWTVEVSADDICKEKTNVDNVCHVFVEHINLEQTNLFFKVLNSNIEALVIHLELPYNTAKASDLSGRIQLSENSSLCLTSKLSESGSGCENSEPERLVISSSTGPQPIQCNNINNKPYVLQIEGSALPGALIHMPKGSLYLSGDAQLRGIIWAHDICAGDHGIELTTEIGEKSIIETAQSLWGWKPEQGYGRMVLRGIRGTGLDVFKRF